MTPARIQIHAKADAATVLGQVLHRQTQPARPRRSEHQPVGALREVLLRERRAEQLVVGPEVVARNARLRNARRAARFKDEHRLAGQALGHPAPHRTAAQPLIFKRAEPVQIIESRDFLSRVEAQARGLLQPERAPRLWIEMPLHDVAHMGVKRVARGLLFCRKLCH